MVKVGMIGLGGIAQAHLANLARLPEVRIQAVCDVDEGRVREAASRWGARGFTRHQDLLAEDLDAVYLCIPPFAHGQVDRDAVARGVPLFVEKPLGLDREFPLSLEAEIARRGLMTQVGYQLRYLPHVQRLRDELRHRAVGLLTGEYLCAMPPTPWWKRKELSGGQLLEQVTHLVDLMRYLGGEATTGRAYVARRVLRDPDATVEDVGVLHLRFASGALGSLSLSAVLPRGFHVSVRVVAEDLYASLDFARARLVRAGGEEEVVAEEDPLWLEDRAFVAAVQEKDPSRLLSPYADAVRTHLLILDALAEEGQPQGHAAGQTPVDG